MAMTKTENLVPFSGVPNRNTIYISPIDVVVLAGAEEVLPGCDKEEPCTIIHLRNCQSAFIVFGTPEAVGAKLCGP